MPHRKEFLVCFDAERMKYPHTGLYHFCNHLGKNIVKINSANNSKLHFKFFLPSKLFQNFGINHRYRALKKFHKLWMPFARKVNLWHCTYQNSRYYPFSSKAKIVLTIHDLNFLHEKKSPLKVAKYKRSLQQKLDRAEAIVTISEYVKEELLQNLDVKHKKVAVIYNGCNIHSQIKAQKPEKIASDLGFVFSIGTIAEKKNFHLLPSLLQNNQLYLVLAGICQNEAYQQLILETARKIGVEERVIILGTVTEAEKYWLLENCTAFAFPSYAEGFGLPVVEAMHFGKPIFLSQYTSLPEIGGNCAYYFKDLDAQSMSNTFNEGLKDFYANPQKAALVKERAAHFTWEKAASEYVALYKTVLNV